MDTRKEWETWNCSVTHSIHLKADTRKKAKAIIMLECQFPWECITYTLAAS